LQISDEKTLALFRSLTEKWTAAHESYLAAIETRRNAEARQSEDETIKSAEGEALAELIDIKKRIDELISSSFKKRRPIVDSIVIATIETHCLPSGESVELPEPRSQNLSRLKRTKI